MGAVRTLECGHVAHESPSKVCPHLARPEDEEISHVRLLTGRRLEYDLACDACDAAGTPITLVPVCEGCVGRRNEDAEYGELSGWRGQPGIDERPEPVDRTVLSWALPRTARHVIDLAAGTDGTWLALTAKGAIVALEPDAERCTVLATRLLIAEPGSQAVGRAPADPQVARVGLRAVRRGGQRLRALRAGRGPAPVGPHHAQARLRHQPPGARCRSRSPSRAATDGPS